MRHLFAIRDVGLKTEGNFLGTYVPNVDDIDAAVLVLSIISAATEALVASGSKAKLVSGRSAICAGDGV